MNKETIQDIKIEKDGDIIPVTVGLYKLFLAHGKLGLDAKSVYEHLIFTARLQETNQVWAKDTYLCEGLHMGAPRLKRAKAFLVKHNLIDYVQRRKEDGTLGDHYINVHIRSAGGIATNPPVKEKPPVVSKTAPPVSRPTGDSKQIPSRNNEMLKKERKEEGSSPLSASFSNSQQPQASEYSQLHEDLKTVMRMPTFRYSKKLEELYIRLDRKHLLDKKEMIVLATREDVNRKPANYVTALRDVLESGTWEEEKQEVTRIVDNDSVTENRGERINLRGEFVDENGIINSWDEDKGGWELFEKNGDGKEEYIGFINGKTYKTTYAAEYLKRRAFLKMPVPEATEEYQEATKGTLPEDIDF